MSKKDYIAIAEIISVMDNDEVSSQSVDMYKSMLVAKLSRLFMKDNEQFKPAKFRAACYLNMKGNR